MGVSAFPDAQCLGKREWDVKIGDWSKEYTWETYSQTAIKRNDIGSGLMKLQLDGLIGSEKKSEWAVGIWSANRPEWQHVSQSCSAYSLILVSLCQSSFAPSIHSADCALQMIHLDRT